MNATVVRLQRRRLRRHVEAQPQTEKQGYHA